MAGTDKGREFSNGKVEEMSCRSIDIQIHGYSCPENPQAKLLVHGTDDVLWTDNKEDALAYLAQELDRALEDC